MRPIESYIIYLAMYVVFYGSLPLGYWATIALGVVTAAHVVLERPRWQLGLVYLQVVHLVYSILLSSTSVWPAGWSFIILSEALLLLSSAIACLFPVATFPVLTGPYKGIGMEERFVTTVVPATSSQHGQRPRSNSVDLTQYPALGLMVFYPSSLTPSTKPGSRFLSPCVARSLGGFLGMPSFLFSALPLARTRAVPNAPCIQSDQKLPVIVFSHGLGGSAGMYACQLSELASQGWVVVAPTHNDGSSCLTELSGQLSIEYKRLPGKALHDHAEIPMRASQIRTRSRELKHVLDVIFQGEKDGWKSTGTTTATSTIPPYAGRLDLSHISFIGHSFGATSVLHASMNEPRIRAVVAHDLWVQPLREQNPPVLPEGLKDIPLLVTVSDQWMHWNSNLKEIKHLIAKSGDKAKLVHFKDTRHSNYSDVPMFSQLVARKLGQIGAVEFKIAMKRINDTQCKFLKTYEVQSTSEIIVVEP